MFLNGEGLTAPGPEGERVEDDSFLLLFNGSGEDCAFNLPSRRFGRQWSLVLDTADPDAEAGSATYPSRRRAGADRAVAAAPRAGRTDVPRVPRDLPAAARRRT